jgi:hypothetical protein
MLLGLSTPSDTGNLALLGRIDQTAVDTLARLAKHYGFLPPVARRPKESVNGLPL